MKYDYDSRKPIVIGKTKDGNFEYGECYHLAVALLIHPKAEYVFVKDKEDDNKTISEAYNFLASFKKPIVVITYKQYIKQKNKSNNIGCTAEIFLNNYEQKLKIKKSVQKEFNVRINQKIKDKEKINDHIKKFQFMNDQKKCLIWIRNGSYQPKRNINSRGVEQLTEIVKDLNYFPIYIGSEVGEYVQSSDNLINYYKKPPINNIFLNQLYLMKEMIKQNNIKFSIGMKSGGMDSLAFIFGLPTFYLGTNDSTDRMKKVSLVFNQLKHIPIQGTKNEFFNSFSEEDINQIKTSISNEIVGKFHE